MANETIQIGNKQLGLDELVDARVAARILGLSLRTVQDYAARRQLPLYKITSRSVRYRVRELVEWRAEKGVGVDMVARN